MEKLFADKFVTELGFSSTEEYIENYIKQRVPWIDFPNLDYYKSLFENNYLIIGNCIRTSDRGMIDEFYQIIDEKGNLRGITEIPAHQGIEGIFSSRRNFTVKEFPTGAVYERIFEKNIHFNHRNI